MMKIVLFALLSVAEATAPLRSFSKMASRSVLPKPATRPRSALQRKVSVKADAAAPSEKVAAEPAAPVAKKAEWKGIESLYGGLYDGQVFETYGWDPFGFSKKASKDTLLMFREAELAHSRTAMLAILGILTAERWHPVFPEATGTAMQQAAYVTEQYPAFWFAAGLHILANGKPESRVLFGHVRSKESYIFRPYSADAMTLKDDVIPGDLGFDPLGIKPEYEEGPGGMLERQNQEINNGRLAMLATAGVLAQEALTGQPQG